MTLASMIAGAMVLDFLLGDPQWRIHPVRLMGNLTTQVEWVARRMFSPAWFAGLDTLLTVVVGFALLAGLSTFIASEHCPWLGLAVGTFWVYSTLAPHDLARHGRTVAEALQRNDLGVARKRVGWIVSRDTHALDEQGIARAAVESIAENLVDGVTAALFWTVIGGIIGGPTGAVTAAVAFRAINTLDAMIGHRNETYITFGWAAARLDDVVNFIPARLTLPIVVLAADLLKMRPGGAWRIALRDGQKHASPNSALSEAAVAGALGVQIGGPAVYGGVVHDYPTIGDQVETIGHTHIFAAIRLMLTTSWLCAAIAATVSLMLDSALSPLR